MKTLIVYSSKYGSTKVIAGWIAERLGFDCMIINAKDAPAPVDFDLVILGSGIYEGSPMPELNAYIDRHIKVLEGKNKVVFGVCLDTKGIFVKGKIRGGWKYIMCIIKRFKNPPFHAGLLHGEINPAKLTSRDHKRLMHFYNQILKKNVSDVPYKTKMNKEEVWDFAERIMNKLVGRIY
jgi:menaquinone-dependent protoporphyrinogen IX oxidase